MQKLGEIVATSYQRKMHSRLKFLAYLHFICASSIFWPEFSSAQQQQQAVSLTEKIPLGESQKRRQRSHQATEDPAILWMRKRSSGRSRNCHLHCTCSWDLAKMCCSCSCFCCCPMSFAMWFPEYIPQFPAMARWGNWVWLMPEDYPWPSSLRPVFGTKNAAWFSVEFYVQYTSHVANETSFPAL